eukprot:TRINITY_DN1410_c0_g9_i1.p1 TRINITY_DN1410_c0_g9~~TRINITY_DN1410_c0_g9_i1.p1  ORF type:complete len:669 (+),score=163.30 TRINITY_DN1410_c0_g9_i1:275-2008(+)
MFEPTAEGELPFHNSIRCAIATLQDKIISSENDLVSICFYGTKEKKNINDFEGIYMMYALDVPDANEIMELEKLLQKKTPPFGHYEHSSEFPFGDALWTCSTIFSTSPVKIFHKRIFLFTNNPQPNTSSELRNQAIQRSRDLGELGIDIELFAMDRVEKKFDVNLFFQYIISIPEEDDIGNNSLITSSSFSSRFEELLMRVRRKEFKKRTTRALTFHIGKDIQFAVKLFTLVHETKKGASVWLDAKTNQPVKTITKWVCEDTGSLLMSSQIKHSYEYGREQIVFDTDELQKIKSLDQPGLRLMGFKPRSALKPYHNIRSSLFIYPDNMRMKGSGVLFAALLDRMAAKDKIAIAKYTSSVSPSRFVALVPQLEKYDSHDGTQIQPSGLHLIFLPFADDIRHVDVTEYPLASEEQITKAKKVVKLLRINFDSRNFENPALQKHYASLQALALEREVADDVPDLIVPDLEGMEKFSSQIQEWEKAVYPDGRSTFTAKGKKRKEVGDMDGDGDGDGDDEKGKKRRVVKEEDEIRKLLEAGKTGSITIADMKELLHQNNIKFHYKSKKDDLLALVRSHLGLD